MSNNNNLIIGATGSLGPSVVKALHKQGEKLKLFVRNREKAEKYFGKESQEIFEGNAENEEEILRAAEDTSSIYYLVNVPYQQWEEKVRPLLKTSLNAAVKTNNKFIFPGNVYVYGYPEYNPVDENHPHETKTKKGNIRIEMEEMIENFGLKENLNYSIVRFPDFYGPFVINGFYEQIFINALKGEKIQWFGNLDVPIELIFIEDAGEAMVTVGMSEKAEKHKYNVPGFSAVTARNFLDEIVKQSGKRSKIKSLNSNWIIKLGGLFNPLAREFSEMMYLKQIEIFLDGSKYEETFGSIPKTSYPEGISKTLEWTKKFYDL